MGSWRRSRAEDKAGLTIDEVTAETLDRKIDSFERFDRMLASAEAWRNNALREIDRHRETLGAAIRQAVDATQDVEFRDVEIGETGGGPPIGFVSPKWPSGRRSSQ